MPTTTAFCPAALASTLVTNAELISVGACGTCLASAAPELADPEFCPLLPRGV